jgi:ribosomal protein L22
MAVERKKGGGESGQGPKGGRESAEPAKRGEEAAPGTKGDGETAPQTKGGGESAPRTKGDGETTPRTKGGGESAPRAKGGGERVPRRRAKEAVDDKGAPAKPTSSRRARSRPATSAPAERRPVAPPVVRARAKYVRSSARKARLVIDHIRGKSVAEARGVLRHTPRGIARDIEKLLASAVANAENNHELVGDDLVVKEAYADEGPTLKRWRPRARGRASRIRKRTSHLTLTLTPRE